MDGKRIKSRQETQLQICGMLLCLRVFRLKSEILAIIVDSSAVPSQSSL